MTTTQLLTKIFCCTQANHLSIKEKQRKEEKTPFQTTAIKYINCKENYSKENRNTKSNRKKPKEKSMKVEEKAIKTFSN